MYYVAMLNLVILEKVCTSDSIWILITSSGLNNLFFKLFVSEQFCLKLSMHLPFFALILMVPHHWDEVFSRWSDLIPYWGEVTGQIGVRASKTLLVKFKQLRSLE
jgi:hypothetical protein